MAANRWRPLRPEDLETVSAIAAAAFPLHYEDPACFAERLRLSPSWCFGLEDGTHTLKGYLIAYPWPLRSIPPLNTRLDGLPVQSRALFLHDLALLPEVVGAGQAKAVIEELALRALGGGYKAIALVAVNNTSDFWRRHGFVVVHGDAAVQAKLAVYGEGARYMVRSLADDPT